MQHNNFGSNRVSLPSSGPISGQFTVYLKRNTITDMVTAEIRGSDTPIVGVYIYGSPTVEVDYPKGRDKGSQENPGKPGEVIQNAFTATVKDGKGSGIPGVMVRFGNPTTNIKGDLIFNRGNSGTLVNSSNGIIPDGVGGQVTTGSGKLLYVRTNSSGKSSVNIRLGDMSGEDQVPVDVVGIDASNTIPTTFMKSPTDNTIIKAHSGSGAGTQLSVLRIQSVSGTLNTFNLYALVEVDGVPPTETELLLERDGTTTIGSLTEDIGEHSSMFCSQQKMERSRVPLHRYQQYGSDLIQGALLRSNSSRMVVQIHRLLQVFIEEFAGVHRETETVTFDVLGGAPTSRRPPPPPTTPARLDISVFGEDGDTSRAVIVNALNSAGQAVSISIPVTLSGSALVTSQTVNTGAVTTITPPTTPGSYTLIATDPAGNYASDTETITVGGPAGEGTLDVTTVGVPVNNQQDD